MSAHKTRLYLSMASLTMSRRPWARATGKCSYGCGDVAIDHLVGLGENRARDLLVVAGGLRRRVRELRGIDGDDADADQPAAAQSATSRRRHPPVRSRGLAKWAIVAWPALGWHRSLWWRCPRRTGGPGAATSARPAHSCRAAAPPSSPDRAPPAHPRQRDRRWRKFWATARRSQPARTDRATTLLAAHRARRRGKDSESDTEHAGRGAQLADRHRRLCGTRGQPLPTASPAAAHGVRAGSRCHRH